jgi:hypothetical protein
MQDNQERCAIGQYRVGRNYPDNFAYMSPTGGPAANFIWRTEWKHIVVGHVVWLDMLSISIVYVIFFRDRDRGLIVCFCFHKPRWGPRNLGVYCRENVLYYMFIHYVIKLLLYVTSVKLCARSPRFYVLGFFKVCCKVRSPSFINTSRS